MTTHSGYLMMALLAIGGVSGCNSESRHDQMAGRVGQTGQMSGSSDSGTTGTMTGSTDGSSATSGETEIHESPDVVKGVPAPLTGSGKGYQRQLQNRDLDVPATQSSADSSEDHAADSKSGDEVIKSVVRLMAGNEKPTLPVSVQLESGRVIAPGRQMVDLIVQSGLSNNNLRVVVSATDGVAIENPSTSWQIASNEQPSRRTFVLRRTGVGEMRLTVRVQAQLPDGRRETAIQAFALDREKHDAKAAALPPGTAVKAGQNGAILEVPGREE